MGILPSHCRSSPRSDQPLYAGIIFLCPSAVFNCLVLELVILLIQKLSCQREITFFHLGLLFCLLLCAILLSYSSCEAQEGAGRGACSQVGQMSGRGQSKIKAFLIQQKVKNIYNHNSMIISPDRSIPSGYDDFLKGIRNPYK